MLRLLHEHHELYRCKIFERGARRLHVGILHVGFCCCTSKTIKEGSRLPVKDYAEDVTKDVERVADEYVKRMQRNYARSGNATDPLITGDGQMRKTIAEEV